ncbi:hypothetical protein ACHAQI_008529 [Fusarium lateritium]
MQLPAFNLLALASLAALFLDDAKALSTLKVKTQHGVVTGFKDGSTNVAQFLGIPYAEPPVNERRWAPAIEKKRFGSLNAKAFAPSCPQSEPATTGPWAPEFLIKPNSTSEDCLYLNVWASYSRGRSHAEPLPVIVWIHGGGFGSGGGNIVYQVAKKWVERSQQHIVVGINYRLGLFGFPNAPGLDPKEQNLGLLDQRLAVEWVRNNIARFGGDPHRIIIWGQSAGAASVAYYQYAYPYDPIAAGYIQDSGSSFLGITSMDKEQTNFTSLARAFDCKNNYVECLRQVPFKDIQKYVETSSLSFLPVNDERTKFSDYTARISKVPNLPTIIGSNRDEGDFGVPRPIWTGKEPPNQVVADSTFSCPAHYETALRSSKGAKTWRYMYSANYTNIMPGGEGAFHSAELPLIMGTHDEARGKSTKFEYEVSHAMQDYWLAFAQNPLGGLTRLGWNPTPVGGVDVVQKGIEYGFNNSIVVRKYAWASLQITCKGAAAVR